MSVSKLKITDGTDRYYPMATFILEDVEVVYADLVKGHIGKSKEQEFLVGVKVSAKDRGKILDATKELWKASGFKGKMEHSPERWFKEDEDDAKAYVLWIGEKVSKLDLDNLYEREDGTDFTLKNFEKLGAGSVVDISTRLYLWNNTNGKGVSITFNVVKLKEFVAYSSKSTSLGGTKLGGDSGVNTAPKDKKKDKKKKKTKRLDDTPF